MTRVKHFSGATLKVGLLALHTNIRLGWKVLPGANIITYYEHSKIMDAIRFIIQDQGVFNIHQLLKGPVGMFPGIL